MTMHSHHSNKTKKKRAARLHPSTDGEVLEKENTKHFKRSRTAKLLSKNPLATINKKVAIDKGNRPANKEENKIVAPATSGENQNVSAEDRNDTVQAPEADYSNFSLFRSYLTDIYLQKGFFHPPAVLELASLFIRCLLSVKRDMVYLRNLRGFETNARKFHVRLIAALSWIYADCYTSALPGNKSRIQTLRLLSDKDPAKAETALELASVLRKCAHKTYTITESEVMDAKIGGWFNNRISQIKKGVWSVDQRTVEKMQGPPQGLYLPFYLVLRAIHPNCSLVSADSPVQITLAEVWQLMLEPRLYAKELHHISAGIEVKLLPRDPTGVNYNLWFLYDCLQPEPFWSQKTNHYFMKHAPGFQERRFINGMETLETEATDKFTSQGSSDDSSETDDDSAFPYNPA